VYRRAFLSTWDADDDLAFFSKDTKPQPAEEWAKVLAWVRGAEPSVLWRWEPMRGPGGYEDPTGERVRRLEAVVTRRFEAGEIVLVLSRIDTPKQPTPEGEAEEEGEEEGEGEGEAAAAEEEASLDLGTWAVCAMEVRIAPEYHATAPLETWYDRTPFAGFDEAAAEEAPAPPPDVVVVEEEGEEEGDDAEEEEAAAAPAAD